jgi:hypothetical protein
MKKKPVKRASKGVRPKNIKMAEVVVAPITVECIMKIAKEMDDMLAEMRASRQWVPMTREWPCVCRDILFTDGEEIYFGWLETYEPGEDPCFVAKISNPRQDSSPDGITHWMPLPKLPNKD